MDLAYVSVIWFPYSIASLTSRLENMLRSTQRFVSGNICPEGLNRLRYSNLIAVKARDFFGETSRRTFATRGLISSYCFQGTNMSFIAQNKVS